MQKSIDAYVRAFSLFTLRPTHSFLLLDWSEIGIWKSLGSKVSTYIAYTFTTTVQAHDLSAILPQ